MLRPYKIELVLSALGLRFRPGRYRQRKEIDKSFRVLGIVAAHRKAGQIGAIQRERRLARSHVERTLPQFQADGAGHELLSDLKETVERFAQRREPHTVVNEFRVSVRQRLHEM